VRDETDDETRARSTRSTRRRLDRAPAARRHRAFARRGATIETRRRVGRTRARLSALARIIDGWTPSTSRPRLARSRRRSPDRVVARTRRRRVSPARDARASGRLGARREGGAREERERETGRRARTTRADAGPRPRRRATRIFFVRVASPDRGDARRPTRGDGRAARTRTRMCDFELIRSIAIVRRARRCASPPRARL